MKTQTKYHIAGVMIFIFIAAAFSVFVFNVNKNPSMTGEAVLIADGFQKTDSSMAGVTGMANKNVVAKWQIYDGNFYPNTRVYYYGQGQWGVDWCYSSCAALKQGLQGKDYTDGQKLVQTYGQAHVNWFTSQENAVKLETTPDSTYITADTTWYNQQHPKLAEPQKPSEPAKPTVPPKPAQPPGSLQVNVPINAQGIPTDCKGCILDTSHPGTYINPAESADKQHHPVAGYDWISSDPKDFSVIKTEDKAKAVTAVDTFLSDPKNKDAKDLDQATKDALKKLGYTDSQMSTFLDDRKKASTLIPAPAGAKGAGGGAPPDMKAPSLPPPDGYKATADGKFVAGTDGQPGFSVYNPADGSITYYGSQGSSSKDQVRVGPDGSVQTSNDGGNNWNTCTTNCKDQGATFKNDDGSVEKIVFGKPDQAKAVRDVADKKFTDACKSLPADKKPANPALDCLPGYQQGDIRSAFNDIKQQVFGQIEAILGVWLNDLFDQMGIGEQTGPRLWCGDQSYRKQTKRTRVGMFNMKVGEYESKQTQYIMDTYPKTVEIDGSKAEVTSTIYEYAINIKIISGSNLQWLLYFYNSCTGEDSLAFWYKQGQLSKGQVFMDHYAGDTVFDCSVTGKCRFDQICFETLKENKDKSDEKCFDLKAGAGFESTGTSGSTRC